MSAPPSSNNRKPQYTSVVFAAYVVPTIPTLDDGGSVGDPNGSGYVSGRYVGLENPLEDMTARFKLLEVAAAQAYDMAAKSRNDPKALHVFVCPEFFFRGVSGAYASSVSDENGHEKMLEHQTKLMKELAGGDDDAKYDHWLFVCGSTLQSDAKLASEAVQQKATHRDELISAIIKAYNDAPDKETKDFTFDLLTKTTEYGQAHPLYTVRNRSFLYQKNSAQYPDGLSVEKRYVSHEDFVVSLYSPQIYSEASSTYPTVDEADGELKASPFDDKCIFTLDGGVTVAVEICLDHRRGRLKRVREDHDATGSVPVDIHLVPSCGMQIQAENVVARLGGAAFNCDGQYAERDGKATPDDGRSIWTGAKDGKGHSQLCVVTAEPKRDASRAGHMMPTRVARPAVGGGEDANQVAVEALKVPESLDVRHLEAYGAGEVHVYSKVPLPGGGGAAGTAKEKGSSSSSPVSKKARRTGS